MEFKVGQIVTGIYKTGKYIGEITQIKPAHYLMRVLAVLKHPEQGDLHNPKQVDVPIFHERRALAFREQVNIPKTQVREFSEEVPDYKESLKQALDKQFIKLQNLENEWEKKSYELLQGLQKDYF